MPCVKQVNNNDGKVIRMYIAYSILGRSSMILILSFYLNAVDKEQMTWCKNAGDFRPGNGIDEGESEYIHFQDFYFELSAY